MARGPYRGDILAVRLGRDPLCSGSPHQAPSLSYTYGTTPPAPGAEDVTYGQVTGITDGLSGVSQTIYYTTSGGGKGQASQMHEANGGTTYDVYYTYNSAGDRATAMYATPNGTVKWGYGDWISVGAKPESPSRAFQTLNKLDANGNPTSEEFHYEYDTAGRLTNAAFMQTPQTGQSGYSSNYPAAVRARLLINYDVNGTMLTIQHFWDTWGGSSYTSTPILGAACSYDAYKLLKTQTGFYSKNPNSNAWLLERNETYTYDADLDWLTSASYNDGLPNASPTWTYDAAGNRNDATQVDGLNRAGMIGGVACTNDILGDRLTCGSTTYGWDCLNRMTSLNANTYQYRADGMRVQKTVGSVVTRYRYDGQMGFEDSDSTGTFTRYGIGGRGIDYIEKNTGGTTAVVFPLYDPLGNLVGLLSRSGNNSYTLSNRRSFDAWGNVRLGATTGDPASRYCGNLGHKQDDESGLVYMRARYYEPTTGRFISEDPGLHGSNWYVYVSNKPTRMVDRTGKEGSIVEIEVGTDLGGALDEINADFFGGELDFVGDPLEITARGGPNGAIRDFLMSKGENPLDWGHFAQQYVGNGPGSGFLKAWIKFDGQLAEAFLDIMEEDGIIAHDSPYCGDLL